jgi:thioesterase domain-containing protein
LGPDQPVYGFQTPGFYGEQALYTRVEDLAAHYVEALRVIRPAGPYFLGGWSLGGIIAYEMAQQLVAQGHKISQLLLLDCAPPIPLEEPVKGDDDAEKLIDLLSMELPISSDELQMLQGDARIDYILKRAKSAKILPPDVEVAQVRSFLKLYRTNVRAMYTYVPQVYPGTATLFKAADYSPMLPSDGSARSERVLKMIQDPTLGWGDLITSGVRIVDVPGNHYTMGKSPYVQILALRIKECLRLG